MRYIYLRGYLMGAVAMLAGCASAGAPSSSDRVAEILKDVRVGEEVGKICFAANIDGFRNNTRDSVVLTRGVSDDYLVLVKGCSYLDDAQSIGLQGTGSCLRRTDRLVVSDSAFSLSGTSPRGPDRCWVDAIYKWDRKAEAKDGVKAEAEMDEK